MNFLANENFPLSSIKLLRSAGYKLKSILEVMPGANDNSVLELAHKEKLIILTFDRDYGELVYKHKSSIPAGVVYFRFDPFTPEEPAEILLSILQEGKVSLLEKFTVMERGRIRQRSLTDKMR